MQKSTTFTTIFRVKKCHFHYDFACIKVPLSLRYAKKALRMPIFSVIGYHTKRHSSTMTYIYKNDLRSRMHVIVNRCRERGESRRPQNTSLDTGPQPDQPPSHAPCVSTVLPVRFPPHLQQQNPKSWSSSKKRLPSRYCTPPPKTGPRSRRNS
jgi:hypothetical protein